MNLLEELNVEMVKSCLYIAGLEHVMAQRKLVFSICTLYFRALGKAQHGRSFIWVPPRLTDLCS